MRGFLKAQLSRKDLHCAPHRATLSTVLCSRFFDLVVKESDIRNEKYVESSKSSSNVGSYWRNAAVRKTLQFTGRIPNCPPESGGQRDREADPARGGSRGTTPALRTTPPDSGGEFPQS